MRVRQESAPAQPAEASAATKLERLTEALDDVHDPELAAEAVERLGIDVPAFAAEIRAKVAAVAAQPAEASVDVVTDAVLKAYAAGALAVADRGGSADDVLLGGLRAAFAAAGVVPRAELAEAFGRMDAAIADGTRLAEKLDQSRAELEATRAELVRVGDEWREAEQAIVSLKARAEAPTRDVAAALLTLTEHEWGEIQYATMKHRGDKSHPGGNSTYWGARVFVKDRYGVDDTWETRQERRAAGHEREDAAYIATALKSAPAATPARDLAGEVDALREAEPQTRLSFLVEIQQAIEAAAARIGAPEVDDHLLLIATVMAGDAAARYVGRADLLQPRSIGAMARALDAGKAVR